MPSIRLRLFLLSCPLFVALLAIGWFAWSRSTSPISRNNLDRIRIGMTRAEVEHLLGGHAGDYPDEGSMTWHDHSNDAIVWPAGKEQDARRLPVVHVHRWVAEVFAISVSFDEADRVVLAYGCYPVRKPWYDDFERWPWK